MTTIENRLQAYINGRSCELLGLGVSHLPLAKLLCDMGVPLTVRDKKPLSELGEDALALAERGVRFVTGETCFDDLDGELIFRSPGIRPDRAGLPAAVERGAELTGEIELFLHLTDADTFAVTGSDGKTTSTTLTGLFLKAQAERTAHGQVFVGGNIGTPLLDRLPLVSKDDRAVLELSSFQLMTLRDAPRFAAITNLSPNHLDWHTDMAEYLAAKEHIIGENTERLVTNADNETTAHLAENLLTRRAKGEKAPALVLFSSTKTAFSALFPQGAGEGDRALYLRDGYIVLSDGKGETALLDTRRIRVPGRHNIENFMTAIGLTLGSVAPAVYGEVADTFCGVAHRLEHVRTLDGVDYYNSSIDSSPSRTAAALSALAGRDIVIICGGYDKHIPFAPLAESLCRHARAVVLTGATAATIGQALIAYAPDEADRPTVVYRPDFADAIRAARSLSHKGGCVLLSPACASFDAFRNFAERGNTFRKIVGELE